LRSFCKSAIATARQDGALPDAATLLGTSSGIPSE
jgi:hypothetical protein